MGIFKTKLAASFGSSPPRTRPFGNRYFHATRKQRSHLLDSSCLQAYQLLSDLHVTTGLSWGLAIPLSALIARTVLFAPLAVWIRKQSQRAQSAGPLLQAWSPIIRDRVRKQYGSQGPEACSFIAKDELRAKRVELFKIVGFKPWVRYLPILQLPIWLLPMETLRRMCGARQGLLSYLASLVTEGSKIESVPAPVSIEASFANEGILWFEDLLAPDPILILPFMLTAALWINVTRHDRQLKLENVRTSKTANIIQPTLKVLALVAAPVAMQLPSALTLYWISSALTALASNTVIDKLFPLPKVPRPCRVQPRAHEKIFEKR